jgi:hypothetical protein
VKCSGYPPGCSARLAGLGGRLAEAASAVTVGTKTELRKRFDDYLLFLLDSADEEDVVGTLFLEDLA